MTTLIEVREVMDATLVAMATIKSSWVIRAVSLLGGAAMEGGPEDGVWATGSAGRELCAMIVTLKLVFHEATTHLRINSVDEVQSYLEALIYQFECSLCVGRSQEAVD